MISAHTKEEARAGNIGEAVRHARKVIGEMRRIQNMTDGELIATARDIRAPYQLVPQIHDTDNMPALNFAARGITTPAGAALMMQLGVDGVFVSSSMFKSEYPEIMEIMEIMTEAIVRATLHHNDTGILADISKGLGVPMPGLDVRSMPEEDQLAVWDWQPVERRAEDRRTSSSRRLSGV